jgi:hypothetical protein
MRMPAGLPDDLFIAGFFMFGVVVDVRLLKQVAVALGSVASPCMFFLVSLGADVHHAIEERNSTLS